MLTRPVVPFLQFLAVPALDAPIRVLEVLPIAAYACDREGRIQWFNGKAVELWGRTPHAGEDGELFCGFFKTYVDGREIGRGESKMAEVLRTGVAVHGVESAVGRPDGSCRWVMAHIEPVRDEHGELIGAISCLHDTTAAHEAHDAVRQRQQELEDFFDNGAVALHLVGQDGTILRANQAELDLLGYRREEYVGRNISEFHADPPVIGDILSRLCAGQKLDKYPARLLAKDGSIKHVLISSSVQFRDGQFINTRCFTVDVTASKLADMALHESDQRLAATYQHAAIGISEVDADGRLLRVNETVCAITGYSQEELLKLTVFDVTHPEDRVSDLDCFRGQVAGKGGSYAVEKRLICKDGRVIWVSVASSSVYDQAGRFLYGIRVMQDITARKHAEEMVRESEQHLRQLLEALPAAVYTTDADGRVTFYNQAAVELSGRQPRLGSDEWCVTWRLYHPDGTPMPHDQCPMAVALKENRAVRGQEAVAERPDGTRVPFIPYPTPLRDSLGRVVGAVNMLVDITERKRAEDRQKALVDELNHRVKNTLATVQSLAAQTLQGSEATEKARDDFSARLFALSKAHDQLSRAGWQSADFQSIVDGIFAPYRILGGDQVRISGPPVRLQPNAALLLAMVVHELATNAAKYGALSAPCGTLDVSWTVAQRGDSRRLVIEWLESGGPQVKPPERQGFGSRLAERAISHELNGSAQMVFDPAGIRCKFDIPLVTSPT